MLLKLKFQSVKLKLSSFLLFCSFFNLIYFNWRLHLGYRCPRILSMLKLWIKISFFYKSWFVLCCSVVSDSATPQTVARQAPLSIGFFSWEYWSGLPSSPFRDWTRDPCASCFAGGFFIHWVIREANKELTPCQIVSNIFLNEMHASKIHSLVPTKEWRDSGTVQDLGWKVGMEEIQT